MLRPAILLTCALQLGCKAKASLSVLPLPTGSLGAATGFMGTDGPLVLKGADAETRWIVYCQARKDTNGNGKLDLEFDQHGAAIGDSLSLYMNLKEGAGEEIQRYWGSDHTGRYLLIEQSGGTWLVDIVARQRSALKDWGASRYKHPDSAPASFDQRGHILFHRADDKGATFVVRTLAGGEERSFASTARAVVSAKLNRTGEWLFFQNLERDTNGNGALQTPRIRSSLAQGPCTGRAVSYTTFGLSGDIPVVRVRSLLGKTASKVLLQPPLDLGDSLLIANDAGGYSQLDTNLEETPLIPPKCKAEIWAVHPRSEKILASCENERAGRSAMLFGPSGNRDLGFDFESLVGNFGPAIIDEAKDDYVAQGAGWEWTVDLANGTKRRSCSAFVRSDDNTRLECSDSTFWDPLLDDERPRALAFSSDNQRLVPSEWPQYSTPRGPMRWLPKRQKGPKKAYKKISIVPACDADNTRLCVAAKNSLMISEAPIRVDAQGHLWLAGMGGVYRFDGKNWALERKRGGAPSSLGLAGGADGQLWEASRDSITHWGGQKWRAPHQSEQALLAIHAFSSENVWAAGERGMLLLWNGREWQKIEGPGVHDLTTLFSPRKNQVWATEKKSLLLWDGMRWSRPRHPKVKGFSGMWGCSADDVWASEVGGGLLHWDGSTWRKAKKFAGKLTAIHGSSCDNVWTIEDKKNPRGHEFSTTSNLWRWNGRKWSRVAYLPSVSGVFATPKATWFVGSNELLRLPLAE